MYALTNSRGTKLKLLPTGELRKVEGRAMEVWTAEPAVQPYPGNSIDGSMSAFGHRHEKHGALCLEAQHYPDSPNHAGFPSTLLEPAVPYLQGTVYKFRTR